jgi:hypothetical protein
VAHQQVSSSKDDGSEAPKRDYFTGSVVGRKPRSIPVSQAVQNWLRLEYEKADSGLIKRDTVDKKAGLCRRHLVPYLESKGITRTAQIDATTFEGYPIYRSSSTPLARRQNSEPSKSGAETIWSKTDT